MEAEVSLLEQCNRTSRPQEVYYSGPVLGRDLSRVWSQESSDAVKAATLKRRKRMRDGINTYSLVQLRHVLMVKEKGGTTPPEVLFALDKLLEWYDDGLQSKGFDPSGLRHLLREHNFQRREDFKEQTDKKATWETHSHLKVPVMIISPEEKNTFCKQMRAKINKEETMLDLVEGEVMSSETHRKIWECTCQQVWSRMMKLVKISC